jgi:hypothetical protein
MFVDIDHPQGIGQLITYACPVFYHIVIPNDIEMVPYFVLITFGTHNHIPPPPNLPLEDNIQDIEDIIRPMLTPGLTRCKLD